MLAFARTFTLLGVDARDVRVEVDVRAGLPGFTLVGLPDTAVRESRERVRAALGNSGFEFPNKRITANLAPADLRKAGPGFDLAIAAAILAATGQIPTAALDDVAFAGELALDGSIRPVPGALPMAERASSSGLRAIVVSTECVNEAALIAPGRVIPFECLAQLLTLGGDEEPQAATGETRALAPPDNPFQDLSEIRGQPGLVRALEVAAAGGHSLLMTGPPGVGKSMAARRLPSILPPLDEREVIEAARVASSCGRSPDAALRRQRPFRAPHHTVSSIGLIGGGTPPRPGEVTLAHRGVLFLDELPEFRRNALEALRQPLEDGTVRIVRASYAVELPCRFQLIAAANPCPCGRGARSGDCTCERAALRGYEAKLTAALADRIDVAYEVEQPDLAGFEQPGEPSRAVRDRVLAARERQRRRGAINAEAPVVDLRIPRHAADVLGRTGSGRLSGRGRARTLRLARTIADLDQVDDIRAEHVEEALVMRRKGSR